MKERKFLTLKMFCSFIVQQFRRLVCFHQNQSLLLPSDRVRNCPRDARVSQWATRALIASPTYNGKKLLVWREASRL